MNTVTQVFLVWLKVSPLCRNYFYVSDVSHAQISVLLYAKNFFFWGGGGVYTPPPPGISGSTYAMKLKLTPGMALDKRS